MATARSNPFPNLVTASRDPPETERRVLGDFVRLVPGAPSGLVTRDPLWRPEIPARVGNLLPAGLSGHARLLHPLQTAGPSNTVRLVTWKEVLRVGDLMSLRSVSWNEASTRFAENISEFGGVEPLVGHLDQVSCQSIAAAIEQAHGTDEEAYFIFWAGHGAVRLTHDAVYRGPVGAVEEFVVRSDSGRLYYQSPSVWWSRGQGWCVATHTDYCSTYIGASEMLLELLLRHDTLEAIAVEVDDPVDDWTAG